MDHPLPPVNLDHFSLSTFVGTSDHLNFIILADGYRSDVVLVFECRRERRAHQHAPHTRRGREMGLPRFPPGAADSRVELHCSLREDVEKKYRESLLSSSPKRSFQARVSKLITSLDYIIFSLSRTPCLDPYSLSSLSHAHGPSLSSLWSPFSLIFLILSLVHNV
eukprot:c10254_g1_i1 orf=1-492(-)